MRIYRPEDVAPAMKHDHVEDCECAGRAIDLRCVESYAVSVTSSHPREVTHPFQGHPFHASAPCLAFLGDRRCDRPEGHEVHQYPPAPDRRYAAVLRAVRELSAGPNKALFGAPRPESVGDAIAEAEHGQPCPCPCATREDHDGERITTHCAAHCPRVAAGDWSECRGC